MKLCFIKRALKIVDKLIIAIAKESNKDYFFSSEERVVLTNKSLFKDIKLNKKKIWNIKSQRISPKRHNDIL